MLLLLFGFGSVVFEVTLAVLLRIPAGAEAITFALIRTLLELPEVIFPRDKLHWLDVIAVQVPKFKEYSGLDK